MEPNIFLQSSVEPTPVQYADWVANSPIFSNPSLVVLFMYVVYFPIPKYATPAKHTKINNIVIIFLTVPLKIFFTCFPSLLLWIRLFVHQHYTLFKSNINHSLKHNPYFFTVSVVEIFICGILVISFPLWTLHYVV